ncbi:MAG: N-6 DNA methylase [Verrucomicrobia bacterium]|nr:N-6 DNA methylase [Verrucomicrobiota bacterium]
MNKMLGPENITFWRTGRTTPSLVDAGLVAVGDSAHVAKLPADTRGILKKASEQFGATHVFFRSRPGRPSVPEALVFDDSDSHSSRSNEQFAELHRRLWSWGAVPLVYRRSPGRVDVFRCAHKPDFDTKKGQPEYAPYDSIQLIDTAAEITAQLEEKPWWDMRRLANGTLWDDRTVAQKFLSDASAHKTILGHVEALEKQLVKESRLASNLRRRLLIISLLVAYLEDREVFKLEANFFARFKPGAEKFFHVLGDASALIKLLHYLETERFNGNVFSLDEDEKHQLLQTPYLRKFAEVIEGVTEPGGQQTLWRLYSFHDLPVELISHIYQLFVEDKTTCVYTPPFLARLMLEEALSLDRMDRLEERNEIVFDPACGSGIFLVEAFKRLVLHWRKNNDWESPTVEVLRKLMQRVGGTDVDRYAVELAAFSLCLAMCEELPKEAIFKTRKLFPTLKGKTLIESCFFKQARERKLPQNIGVAVGNPPFGSASKVGTTEQAYNEYLATHGKQSLPDRQSAYLFMHHCMEAIVPNGLICLIQKDNFLYNRRSIGFRQSIFERWDVRQILDFTPIRGMFFKDPKVVVVMAEASSPQPKRSILHAIFRRTVHTQAELSFELDYYDMHWLPRQCVMTKDFVWRCNLFGGGRAVGLVERLKKLPTLKEYVRAKGWDYGEGFMVGTPTSDEVIDFLYDQPVIPAKAVLANGTVDETLIETQSAKHFYYPTRDSLYKSPTILIRQTDSLQLAYWQKSNLTYNSEVLGIASNGVSHAEHRATFDRIFKSKSFFQAWIALTSTKAGLQKATALNKSDIDDFPFPDDEADLDLTENEEIILGDAFGYYRDFQRLGDDAAMMRKAEAKDYEEFASVFTRQINAVHKKLRPLPVKSWAGVSCQPFIFGKEAPDWTNAESLNDKLSRLLRTKKSPSFTTVRILRIFDGPFIFLIKPDRLRYWLKSIALRDADEALADLRALGF